MGTFEFSKLYEVFLLSEHYHLLTLVPEQPITLCFFALTGVKAGVKRLEIYKNVLEMWKFISKCVEICFLKIQIFSMRFRDILSEGPLTHTA